MFLVYIINDRMYSRNNEPYHGKLCNDVMAKILGCEYVTLCAERRGCGVTRGVCSHETLCGHIMCLCHHQRSVVMHKRCM